MKLIFHPEANQEFLESIDYYEAQQPGLGEDFHAETMATVARVAKGPNIWPVLEGEVRRCLMHRFPFGVLYSAEVDCLYILAVMHLRREPGYWKHRIDR